MKAAIHILRPIGIALAVGAVILTLGFVERTTDSTLITDVRVEFTDGSAARFIDEHAVRQAIMDMGQAVIGADIGSVDITRIENGLRGIPCVSQAEVFHTMDGVLHARIEQRMPIVRVLRPDGTSCYIDKDGWVMPTDPDHTAHVLVVTGHVQDPWPASVVHYVYTGDSVEARSRMDEIHRLAGLIGADPFWDAMIDHVVLTATGDFELIPRIGGHRIMLGDGREARERLEKLRIFYEQGIPRSDWRRYAYIDLRYADQIVCTKRTTP